MFGTFEHPGDEIAVLQDRERRLDGVQFGTVRRQPKQGDVGGDLQFIRLVPSRPVQDDECVLPRSGVLADVPEMVVCLSCAGSCVRMLDCGPGLGTGCGAQLDVSEAMVLHGAGAG